MTSIFDIALDKGYDLVESNIDGLCVVQDEKILYNSTKDRKWVCLGIAIALCDPIEDVVVHEWSDNEKAISMLLPKHTLKSLFAFDKNITVQALSDMFCLPETIIRKRLNQLRLIALEKV